MSTEDPILITRREAIARVSAILGGIALVGGSSLLTGCRADRTKGGADAEFSADDIAFLDEVADTILPETKTPGAKAARTGAFMALMVRDSYDERDQKVFREGMRKLDEESRKANNASFMQATPQQRLALLERLDREQKDYTDRREAARASGAKGPEAKKQEDAKEADKHLSDQRQENAPGSEAGAGGAPAITADAPAHYFRMMKELALLGYFTSEIGYTKAMRYAESPGRFDPCVPYTPGETAWAPHA
ncbi:MAG TPA: gluconate 2-dehydrogenase subunit 3 family protein [Gemmatimonadaceae bacterium]|nr:gluconate 2-dehydrogenase subunit 3 family protein [Gemmatimonadaceae bacterium]